MAVNVQTLLCQLLWIVGLPLHCTFESHCALINQYMFPETYYSLHFVPVYLLALFILLSRGWTRPGIVTEAARYSAQNN